MVHEAGVRHGTGVSAEAPTLADSASSGRHRRQRMEEAKHFIGNRWVAPAVGETIPVVDPSDGQVFAQLARGNAADIDRAVQSARAAYDGAWGHTSAADRGRMLARLSMLIAACK